MCAPPMKASTYHHRQSTRSSKVEFNSSQQPKIMPALYSAYCLRNYRTISRWKSMSQEMTPTGNCFFSSENCIRTLVAENRKQPSFLFGRLVISKVTVLPCNLKSGVSAWCRVNVVTTCRPWEMVTSVTAKGISHAPFPPSSAGHWNTSDHRLVSLFVSSATSTFSFKRQMDASTRRCGRNWQPSCTDFQRQNRRIDAQTKPCEIKRTGNAGDSIPAAAENHFPLTESETLHKPVSRSRREKKGALPSRSRTWSTPTKLPVHSTQKKKNPKSCQSRPQG